MHAVSMMHAVPKMQAVLMHAAPMMHPFLQAVFTHAVPMGLCKARRGMAIELNPTGGLVEKGEKTGSCSTPKKACTKNPTDVAGGYRCTSSKQD